VAAARAALDAWTREVVEWHFNPDTGTPFWLERAKTLGFDPRREIQTYADLDRFGFFQDEWLRGGPVNRWVPRGYAGKPIFTFETGGSTGVPKSRIAHADFRIDYEMFSDTLPDEFFPARRRLGARRSQRPAPFAARSRASRATSRRICFSVDLDPRWVIKLLKRGDAAEADRYKQHVIDQALTILKATTSSACSPRPSCSKPCAIA
jgi:hypothetical protein